MFDILNLSKSFSWMSSRETCKNKSRWKCIWHILSRRWNILTIYFSIRWQSRPGDRSWAITNKGMRHGPNLGAARGGGPRSPCVAPRCPGVYCAALLLWPGLRPLGPAYGLCWQAAGSHGWSPGRLRDKSITYCGISDAYEYKCLHHIWQWGFIERRVSFEAKAKANFLGSFKVDSFNLSLNNK